MVFIPACTSTSNESGNLEDVPNAVPLKTAAVDNLESPPSWSFPQWRNVAGGKLVLHAPQIRGWEKFEKTSGKIAFEYVPEGESKPKFGTLNFTGTTEIDLEKRIVLLSPKISDVKFSDNNVPNSSRDAILNMAVREHMEVPLDLFLSYLSADVLEFLPPEGFNSEPPAIYYATVPTILLFVNGDPVYAPVGNSQVTVLANANWPVFSDDSNAKLYLLDRERWLLAPDLEGPWTATTKLPASLLNIPEAELQPAIRGFIPPVASDQPISQVQMVSKPSELIVIDGQPEIIEIEGTNGLSVVKNTASPLFKLDDSWYFLTSGRWFYTDSLDSGEWHYVEKLPKAFRSIPSEGDYANILASVPGTSAARMASLEAMLPVKQEAALDKPAPEVAYAGEPRFEPISTTEVLRAINTSYDILEYKGQYYLCYEGIWYSAIASVGPWSVTADVPDAIYSIPPSSSAYHVTHVTVYESTPTKVVYTYPPSYTTSIYIVSGVPVYGTGWYYPPYIYGPVYYPYYASYGHGNWYNTNTGGYGSRSVAYGPYGGYSYTQGYNPKTGRYGYVETAWDNDEWASYGQTYNPRTGISSETSRYYDDDDHELSTEREISRGDRSVTTNREIDTKRQESEVTRNTAAGGSSQSQRKLEDGTLSSEGTFTTEDGRTGSFSGEHDRDGGSTTVTGSDGQSHTFERDGYGPGTRPRESSGDLYAGNNGDVYKRTDSGWSSYQGGKWEGANTRESSTSRSQASNHRSSLNRDYNSRQSGYNRHSQRTGGSRSRRGGRRR